MNSDDEDTEEAEVHADTEKMPQPTSDISGTGDTHKLYERRALQYLQLSDGGKALANAVKAVEYRHDSFNAHWLAGKSFVSMAMYGPGIGAFSNAIELCCVEEKRQEILIDLLVHYCSRINNLSDATDVFRNISGHTWATVAYELTKTRKFKAAYTAYSQLQKACPPPSDIHFDLHSLCDLDIVAAETWIVDLVTHFLRCGSDHHTMTSQGGDTYLHVVVRMSLATGVLVLLEYVLGYVVRPEELRDLSDCLGNTALHMAAQFQKCSPRVRLDVITLLNEAGVDETAKNIEGKTASSYLSRNEKDVFKCHQKYDSICLGMTAKKIKQAVDKTYNNAVVPKSEDDYDGYEKSAQYEHIPVQERETTERAVIDAVTSKTHSNNRNQALDTISEENLIQDQTTDNQEQPVSAIEENERPVQEPPDSFLQDIDEESSRSFKEDMEIMDESVPVQLIKQHFIEMNAETRDNNFQNGLPEQQVHLTDDYEDVRDVHSPLDPIEYNDIPPKASIPKNSDATKYSVACIDLTCSNTDEDIDGIENTALHHVQASSVEVISPDDNDNASAKISIVLINDDRDVDEIPVSSVFNDKNDSQTEKKKENGSSENDLRQDVTLDETRAKSSEKAVIQEPDVVLDENASVKFHSDSTGVHSSEDVITDDNSCRETSDEHFQCDIIGHQTVEVDAQQLSVTSDTPFEDPDEKCDDTSSTADMDDFEKEQHSHTHSEQGRHDHDKERNFRSDTSPLCRDDHSSLDPIEYNDKDIPPKAGISKNPDATKNSAACRELTCANTDEENDDIEYTALHHVQANSVEVIFPDDNDNAGAKISIVQKNDDRDVDETGVSSVFNDNNKSQTEKKTVSESSESELRQDVTLDNKTTAKSCGTAVIQKSDVVQDENASMKFHSDSTGANPSEDVITNDTSCRETFDKHFQCDIIGHQTIEVASDTPFEDPDEQCDDTSSTTDMDSCEKEQHLHTHSEQGHHDHNKEKNFRSDTSPHCRDNTNETEVTETESKTTRDKLKSLFKEGKSLLKLKHYKKAFDVFVKLLNIVHARSTNEYITMTIRIICTSLVGSDDEVNIEDLAHISQSHVGQILKGLMDRRKWFPFLSLIREHHAIHASKEKMTDIVSEIRLETIVEDPQFLNKTQELYNLINGLLDAGTSIANEGQNCIYACVNNGHYGILPLLLSRGAHPRHLTIYSGDTPVHAALTIALTKDPGHFEAFELLLAKFQENPQVYVMCDPTAKDGNRDGLLHLVLCHQDSSRFRKAIDLLVTHIPNPLALHSSNKTGKYPVDLIRGKYDPRWETLKPLFRCISAQLKRQKEKKTSRLPALNQAVKSSTDVNNAINETVVSDTEFQTTKPEFPSNENVRNDVKSEISVDDEKVLVAALPIRKDNRIEETREKTKRDGPLEGEEKNANVLQVRKRERNVQKKKEAKEDEVPENEVYKEEKEGNEKKVFITSYTKGKLNDAACKVEAEDDGVTEEHDDEDIVDVNKGCQSLRSKGTAVPAVLPDQAPDTLHTRERLSHMTAEFHHRNSNEVRMMVNLERLEHLGDRITFLKNKGYFDQAGTLLQKEGKYLNATHLYLIHGKSKEAVDTARQSRNKDLIGECLIVDAQVMMRKRPENPLSDEQKKAQKEEVLHILQEAIDILLSISNQELRGEACFLKGEITNEVTDIDKSWGLFNKCNPRCEAGQLECMDWMVRNSDLHNYQNLLQVVKGMDNLFGVLNLLVSSDKAGGDRVFKYYGLRPTSDGFLKMYPYQKPRALNIIKRCLNKAERKKTECEVSRTVARDEICRFLLDRGHHWYGEVTLALNKLKKQREQCKEFILGLNCTKVADGGKCIALHNIMTERDLRSLIDVDLLHLEMDWYVQQGCGRLLKDIAMDLTEMVNVFLPDTANDHMARFKSCEVLLHHLMPRERFPFRMAEKGRGQANKLQEHICKVYIRNIGKRKERKHLKEQMVCYLKAKFNYMKTKERKTNTDVFIKLYFLANYLQLKNVDTSSLMMEFEMEVRNEQKNQPKIKKRLEPLGFLVDEKDLRNVSIHCVARRFCEAYYQLTIPADPMEALIKFTKFIVLLGDRNKTATLPEFSDFLMWIEYFTTIAICFGAKNNPVTNVFFLPASYLSLVYFIDSSFQVNGQPTFELIQRHKKSWGHNVNLSQERAERIISVLCGSSSRMNLIKHLFKVREERALDYAERLLVLCMTVLCNMGKALFVNKEADLMQQLCLIALPEDCPKRLLKAVRAVQEADGLSDIAAALKELLHDRDQEHVCLCHWSSERYGVKSTPLDKLTFLPSTFYNPDTKKKMTTPGQGRMPTEEDEDGTASSLAELDTDMTMEEKFKWESEQKTFQENLRKESAAMVITRFFKKIQFRAQCSILHCLVEEELQKEQTEKRLKKFQQFCIDDRACTICNVIFDKPSGNLIEGQSYAASLTGSNPGPGNGQTQKSPFTSLLNPFTALFGNTNQTPSVEDWPKVSETSDDPTASLDETGDNQHSEENAETWRAKQKLQHEQSLSHNRNVTDFRQLKQTYKTLIAARLEEIVEFIRKHNLKTEKGLQNYADMKLDLTRLVNQSDIAQNEFERILAKRDWGNSSLLTQFFQEVNGCFSNVKPYVEEQWRKLHESKNKAAESSKSRNSQAGLDEDWDEEIQHLEDVVQEPVRQREKKGKGRGRGRGRARQRQQED